MSINNDKKLALRNRFLTGTIFVIGVSVAVAFSYAENYEPAKSVSTSEQTNEVAADDKSSCELKPSNKPEDGHRPSKTVLEHFFCPFLK